MNPQPSASGSTFLGTFLVVFVLIAALFAVDTFLARIDSAEGHAAADRLFAEGTRLMQSGNPGDAVERFRNALFIAHGNAEYSLALGQALAAAGKPEDAQTVLDELLEREPANGRANLYMARVLAQEAKMEESISFYHRATYGQWKGDAAGHRSEVRFELLQLLARQNLQKEMLAELLPLQSDASDDIETQRRIAQLFRAAGSPVRAAEIYRRILERAPQDADAQAGLGDADFARGEYRTAQSHFQAALRLKPGDPRIERRLAEAGQVLALDPMRRGLPARERFRRSQHLVELVLDRMTQCAGQTALGDLDLIAKAEKALKQKPGQREEPDSLELNLDLAQELWQSWKRNCPKSGAPGEEPVALVLEKIAR